MFTLIAEAATAAATTPESGGLAALGVNLSSLLFQVANFALLLWLLKKFAYGPIINILNQRRATIEESLKNAETIAQTKKELEVEKKRILHAAETQATEIITRSRDQASQIVQDAQTEAQAKAERIVADATAALDREVVAARLALKQEVAGLVISATEKLLTAKLDDAADATLIKQALAATEGE